MPLAADFDLAYDRLDAAGAVADDITTWLGGAWMFCYPDEAMRFLDGVPISLGWFEDAFPPGEPRWSPNSGGGSPLPSS